MGIGLKNGVPTEEKEKKKIPPKARKGFVAFFSPL